MDVICRNCGKLVGDEELHCPYCGSMLKKGAQQHSIKLVQKKPRLAKTNKNLLMVAAVLGVILVIAGAFYLLSDGFSNFTFFGTNQTTINNTTSNASTNDSAQNTTENQTPSGPEKSPIEKVREYLQQHNESASVFGEQASRINRVDVSDDVAYLTYTTSEADYSSESTYLVGVILLALEDIETADVKGYTAEGMFMNASHKFKSRSNYHYEFYKSWFPDYVPEIECETDADCIDARTDTRDKCYDGQCSNVVVIS